MTLRRLALVIGLAFAGLAPGGIVDQRRAAAAEPAAVQDLLDLIAFDGYARDVEARYRRAPDDPTMTDDLRAAWERAARSLFSADDLVILSTQTLSVMDEGDVAQLSRFLSSPLGRKATAAELDAQDPLRHAEIARAVEEYADSAAVSAHRGALLERMSDLFGTVDDAVAHHMNFQLNLLRGISASGAPQVTPLDDAQILAFVQESANALRAAIEEEGTKWSAYIYRGLTDEELNDYVDFLATDAARQMYALLAQAETALTQRDAFLLGQGYAQALSQQEL